MVCLYWELFGDYGFDGGVLTCDMSCDSRLTQHFVPVIRPSQIFPFEQRHGYLTVEEGVISLMQLTTVNCCCRQNSATMWYSAKTYGKCMTASDHGSE